MSNLTEHFESLFTYAPISLWEEDYSGIRKFFNELRSQGITDLDQHFNAHPQDVDACMELIKVIHVNRKTLEMFEAASEQQLLDHLDKVFRDEMRLHFHNELLALWNGRTSWAGEGINYTMKGKPLNIRLHWRILPECEQDWKCVLVAIENITPLKQAEARFRHLFNHAPISLWEEDYSGIKQVFDELRAHGVTDLQTHLAEHPELVDHCMSLIRVLDVNQKTLDLFEAPSKETLLASLDRVFRDEMRQHFSGELVDMWNGRTSYEREGINYALNGDPFNIHLDWRLMPGHEDDFAWVLVALQDISTRKKAEEYLRYLGTHDVMTGLYNRAFFEEQLTKLVGAEKLGIIMADLNNLKLVNDSLGHQAGDNFIRRMAEVLKSAFDQEEVVARIGGDEFVILLPDCTAEDLTEAIERIKSLIPLNNKYYQGPELSAAIGGSMRKADESLEKTMIRADNLMYVQKAIQHGTNS